jgi:plasmid stability protein
MAQIVVRKLADEVKDGLRRRAARHGRSLKTEVRTILRDAAEPELGLAEGLGTRLTRRFAGIGLRPGEEIEEVSRNQCDDRNALPAPF